MKEIKYTHQEAQWTPKNTDKQSNSGKEYVNKIRLKLFIIIIVIVFNFWLYWVFVAAHGLSLVAASRHYFSLWTAGFSMRRLLLFGAQALGAQASVLAECRFLFVVCGSYSMGSALVVHGLWVTPQNKFSFLFFFFKETEIIKKGSKQGVCCWFSG